MAFRAGLFNIGGQGQLIAGAICAGWVGFTWHLPVLLHLLVAMIAGLVGGAIWGGIAGWLKAQTGAHEVISTIMLNYIALYLLFYLLSVPGFQAEGSNQAISIPIDATARFPRLFGSGLSVNGSLVVALLAALACWWLLTRSTLGFRLRAVGANQFAARTAGMNVGGSYVTVMLIAGALSGLAGSAQALGGNNVAITGDVDASIGFDAITVALLGRASPGGTVLAGILFGALRAGAVRMQAETGVPTEIVQVIQSVIVLFIAAPALIRAIFRLRAVGWRRRRRAGEGVERMTAPTSPADEELVVVRHVVDVGVPLRTRLIAGGAIILAGLICIFAWGLGANPGDADFGLRTGSDAIELPDIAIPAAPTAIALGLIIVALGAWHAVRGFSRPQMRWVITAVLLCFVVAFLCWASTGSPGNPLNVPGLLQNTILLATPLVLGALAGILCERTGVINVAIEGQFLAGAFAGALGASVSASLGVGVLTAMIAGGLMGALLAVFAIRYLVNQVVLGVVLNAFALGITGFGFDALMASNPTTYNEPGFFSPIAIPLLSDIPVIGPVFFNVNIIVYLTYVLIIVIDVALFRTRWGLRTRAVGEHPKAADTVGIKVLRTRYRNVIMGGVVAGLGGAFLTIGTIGSFTKDISSGKGFIALAAVIFGKWSPRGAVGAALLFGFADALQSLLSVAGTPVPIPSNFLLMLPYLATLFAVAGLVGKVSAPAADGQPYTKS